MLKYYVKFKEGEKWEKSYPVWRPFPFYFTLEGAKRQFFAFLKVYPKTLVIIEIIDTKNKKLIRTITKYGLENLENGKM